MSPIELSWTHVCLLYKARAYTYVLARVYSLRTSTCPGQLKPGKVFDNRPISPKKKFQRRFLETKACSKVVDKKNIC